MGKIWKSRHPPYLTVVHILNFGLSDFQRWIPPPAFLDFFHFLWHFLGLIFSCDKQLKKWQGHSDWLIDWVSDCRLIFCLKSEVQARTLQARNVQARTVQARNVRVKIDPIVFLF